MNMSKSRIGTLIGEVTQFLNQFDGFSICVHICLTRLVVTLITCPATQCVCTLYNSPVINITLMLSIA